MRGTKRIIAGVLAFLMVVSLMVTGGRVTYAENDIATATDAQGLDGDYGLESYKGDNYDVCFTVDSLWDSGYNATITITNTGDEVIENWCVSFPLNETISNIWNASIEETHKNFYVIKNVGWNQDIPVGGSVSFGITSSGAFSCYPEYYTLIGNEVEIKNGDYSVLYEITEDWGDGYKAIITITNNKNVDIEDWRLKFDYADNIITKIWDAIIISDTDGSYIIGCESYNQNISAGKSVSFGVMVEPGCSGNEIMNVLLSEYNTNIYDKFVTLIGYLPDDTRDLQLFLESSEECYKYDIYASIDDGEYTIIGSPDENNEYVYSLPKTFSHIDLYARGYYGENKELDSLVLYVEYINGKYILVMPDSDGDGLEDAIEIYYGSDINNTDSDGDGLDDYYEVAVSGTDPTKEDTDSNGILDGDEDYDSDGLTTFEEKDAGTNPWDDDTDYDNLLDGDEVKQYGTNPLLEDTDEDGLDDESEILLGIDPLNPDTNGNGILDGDEKFEQTFTHTVENEECVIKEVSISLNGTGCLQTNTYIESVMDRDVLCTDVVGLVGEPFEIETDSQFDTATLTFKLDKEKLNDVDFNNLMYLWYDEENQKFVELDTILDIDSGSVSVETTHFSKYMIVDRVKWYNAWTEKIDYNPTFDNEDVVYNTVLAIDCSGSMDSNDKITLKDNVNSQYDAMYRKVCGRIEGANAFINRMSGDDKAAIVLFTNKAYVVVEMTSDKQELRLGMQKVYNMGDTSINAALRKSMEQFDEGTLNNSHYCNRIILLSDGGSSYSKSLLDEIAAKEIKVYTIGLGKGVSVGTLKNISKYTNGEFYKADKSYELEDLYEMIYMSDDFDKTDNDNDGLYDIIETAGIRLINGQIIYTDPMKPDSDYDGLLDGEEIDPRPVYFEKDYANPFTGVRIKGYYFKMKSNPNSIDSDGDGLYDGTEQMVFLISDTGEKNVRTSAPIDQQPLYYDGPKGIWKAKTKYERENYIPHIYGSYREIMLNGTTDYLTNLGSEIVLKFYTDEKCNVLHSKTLSWQYIFGYIDFYDMIFCAGTAGNMRKEKICFEYNDTKFIIWLWKGDYPNLGGGAEMGIYDNSAITPGFWIGTSYNYTMTLSLYYKESFQYNNIFSWMPDEMQWWITGFNPDYRNLLVENMVSIGSIDMRDRKYLYNALKESTKNNYKNIIFDDTNYTVWIVWE